MRITEAMTLDQYWFNPRFQIKKPNLRGSKKQAFGDNIYSKNKKTGSWRQANSHHSMTDGSVNQSNVETDTSANRVLISDDFAYWGGSGPQFPSKFLGLGPHRVNILARRNHRNEFPEDFVQEVIAWFRSLGEKGYLGEPLDWQQTP